MRVVFIAPYPPARDGIGDYTSNLVRALVDQRHEVRVFVPRPLADAPPEVVGALGSSRRNMSEVLAEIDRFDPDVVHVQFAVAGFTTATPVLFQLLSSLRCRRPFVAVTFHELLRDTALLRRGGRMIYRRLAEQADRVFVHTVAARAMLLEHIGVPAERCSVVPFPRAELPSARSTAAQLRAEHALGTSRVLLAFGFIHVDKGLGDLVDAISRVDDEMDVCLVVAGAVRGRAGIFRPFEWADQVHLARIKRSVRQARLGVRVRFIGYVPAGDVGPWFDVADVAVLPYRRIDQSSVTSMAAAADTPVLLSRVGGLAEGADERWTFPPRSPQRLAEVIADFVRAVSLGEAVGAAPGTSPDIEDFAALTVSRYGREIDVHDSEESGASIA
jgi:glycosyltransferase involved in cell wall biosynthesis